MAQVTVDTVLHLQDFGLERLDEDRAIVGFAQKAEAGLVRGWISPRARSRFFKVRGDDESGTFYIYDSDRASGDQGIGSAVERDILDRELAGPALEWMMKSAVAQSSQTVTNTLTPN